jgi:hypothetical protein
MTDSESYNSGWKLVVRIIQIIVAFAGFRFDITSQSLGLKCVYGLGVLGMFVLGSLLSAGVIKVSVWFLATIQ